MRKKLIYLAASLFAIIAVLLTGCAGVFQSASKAPGTQTAGQTTGKLVVMVTDAPTPEPIKEINVTITSLQVHKAGVKGTPTSPTSPTATATGSEEDDDDGGWIDIPLDGASENGKTFDLFEVRNVQDLLGTQTLVSGNYTQIRLEVFRVEIVLDDGKSTILPAKLPSGKLKFVHPFEIDGNQTTEILLDFDAEASLHVTGKNEYMFKPVIKVSTTKAPEKANPLKINTPKLPDGQVGMAYEASLKATGGQPPYTWTVNSTLPTGLSLLSGNITGTPAGDAVGTVTRTYTVTDSSSPVKTASKEFTFEIKPALTP